MARITLTLEDRQRIRELRAAAGLSRPELAEKMRVTEKTIRNIESESSGRATFNDYTIECLARALGTTASEIVSANGKENEQPVVATGHADGPKDAELLSVYAKTTPLSVTIADAVYTVPVELIVPPSHLPHPDPEVEFRLVDGTFAIPEQIEPYTTPIRQRLHEGARRNSRLFDGKVLRLGSLRKEGGKWAGEIQRASYFDALATNLHGLDMKPDSESLTLRERLSGRSHRLEDLEKSLLVNHLGLVCLIESADGKLIVPERSSEVANRRNTLTASVTGAVDFRDAPQVKCGDLVLLHDLAKAAGSRETERELGIEVEKLKFLGLVREFERGGKPEMYYFARSSLSAARIKSAASLHASERYESRTLHCLPLDTADLQGDEPASRAAFEERLKSLLSQSVRAGNLTLRVGLLLLHQSLM